MTTTNRCWLAQTPHPKVLREATFDPQLITVIPSQAGATSVPELTGLTEQQLEQFYSLFASNEKVLTIYSQGVSQSTQGCDKVNAYALPFSHRKNRQAGNGAILATGQPNVGGVRWAV